MNNLGTTQLENITTTRSRFDTVPTQVNYVTINRSGQNLDRFPELVDRPTLQALRSYAMHAGSWKRLQCCGPGSAVA
jgi:hypothetical protein